VPFNVTSVALKVVQERALDCPDRIDIGEAERLAVGTAVEVACVDGVDGVGGVVGVDGADGVDGVGVVGVET